MHCVCEGVYACVCVCMYCVRECVCALCMRVWVCVYACEGVRVYVHVSEGMCKYV